MIKHRIHGRCSSISICTISAEIGAALIGAGASVANATGGILTAKKNRQFTDEQNQKARAWSESMMDKVREQELADREHEERYNSPAMQKLRLQLAGLSPEGTFSQMVSNSVAGGTEMAQAMSPSDYNPSGIGEYVNPIASGIDGFRQMAEIANIKADTNLKGSEVDVNKQRENEVAAHTQLLQVQVRDSLLSAEAQEIINKNLDAKLNAEIRNINADTDKKKSETEMTDSQKKLCDEEFVKLEKFIQDKMPLEIQNLAKTNGLLDKKLITEEKYANMLGEQAKLFDAQINEIVERTNLDKLDVLNYYYNKNSGGFMGTGLSVGNVSREVDRKLVEWRAKRDAKRKPTDSLAGK